MAAKGARAVRRGRFCRGNNRPQTQWRHRHSSPRHGPSPVKGHGAQHTFAQRLVWPRLPLSPDFLMHTSDARAESVGCHALACARHHLPRACSVCVRHGPSQPYGEREQAVTPCVCRKGGLDVSMGSWTWHVNTVTPLFTVAKTGSNT